jgi:hypothetical protein
LPGVASKEKTGSARAAPETTSTTASIALKYRAKDAVSINFTQSSYVNQHNKMPEHIAASLAGKQGGVALCSIWRPHIDKKMSTDVHRF